ncbi:DUF3515 domain-containing protein [Streptomyces sp. NPDC059582]|uniref:DUF3515 domain-containing protein n=1 Tax=Streptomyces sp. NPDC059582 TaxID=3346875 RepID=UPI0036C0F1FA
MRVRSRRVRAAVCLGAAGLIAGSVLVVREVDSAGPVVTAAEWGDDPRCAAIARGYPSSLGGQRRSDPGAAGVTTWGDGAVVLRCGLRPPGPTVDKCVNVDGVDWILLDAEFGDGRKVLVTYGRDPAVELTLTDRAAGTDTALVELSRAVEPIPQGAKCLGDTDV